MGITLSAWERLLAPLQTLVGWGRPAPARSIGSVSRAVAHRPAVIHPAAARTCPPWSPAPASCREHARRGLRVVRVLDACPAPAGAGRMIISGRMADVCAELERLAALEARVS